MSGNVTTTVLDAERGFNDQVTQPQTQSFLGVVGVLSHSGRGAMGGSARKPRIRCASRGLSVTEARRQIALATAQAYLAVIAQQRQVEVNERARENALAHVDYARARLQGGAGSRLNELRASQELATDEVLRRERASGADPRARGLGRAAWRPMARSTPPASPRSKSSPIPADGHG